MSLPARTGGSRILCYVTDRRIHSRGKPGESLKNLLSIMSRVAAAGADWIQIREKDLSGRELARLIREARRQIELLSGQSTSATRILTNDRLDVALSEHAGGIHLGENSLPIAEARRLLNRERTNGDFLIGASCHSLTAAESAEMSGADYLFFGPVFATPSKAAYGEPQGIERLAKICRQVSIPVLAIGGITLENARDCFSAGATGIAAIRMFQDTFDLPSLVSRLRELAL